MFFFISSFVHWWSCQYPSVHLTLIRVMLMAQQSEQRSQDFPQPSHVYQRILGDIKSVPSHLRDIISLANPGSAPETSPCRTYPDYFTHNASKRHPSQIPEPPQLASSVLTSTPFIVEKQRLQSEHHSMSSHLSQQTHFHRMCLQPRYFSRSVCNTLVTLSEIALHQDKQGQHACPVKFKNRKIKSVKTKVKVRLNQHFVP